MLTKAYFELCVKCTIILTGLVLLSGVGKAIGAPIWLYLICAYLFAVPVSLTKINK
jgi:hypothetical protein